MAVKLIMEPIFEADFCEGSYGFRPKRSAHHAVDDVAETLHKGYCHVIDADLSKYFDTIPHDKLLHEPPWYGTVCPVVWEDGGSNPASYPIIVWYSIDEERGWIFCEVMNRMAELDDGEIYQEPNLTILHYAGGGLFSCNRSVVPVFRTRSSGRAMFCSTSA